MNKKEGAMKNKDASRLASKRKTRKKICAHCGKPFKAFGRAKFCSDKCRFDFHNQKRPGFQDRILSPIKERFEQVDYNKLNGKQQEIYNFQHVAAVLATYGFDCMRLANDWNGADFLAQNMVTGQTLKIQLKGRVSIDKKYIGKDLWIVCPLDDHWLAIPHDVLLELIRETTPTFKTSKSWTEDGVRSMKKPSKKLIPLLNPWLL